MLTRKINLGLQKSVSLVIDENSVNYTTKIEKDIKRFLKNRYELELLEETEGFGLKTLEYDADYLIEDWPVVIQDIELEFPDLQLQLFEGTHNEMTDDYRYDYEDLQIDV